MHTISAPCLYESVAMGCNVTRRSDQSGILSVEQN